MSSIIRMICLLLFFYVDDLFFIKIDEKIMHEFKNDMMRKYEMSNLGLLHYFLDIKIDQREDGVFISQKKYVQKYSLKI
jgi:Reverse transcriptase (RNA-dependent DNA polymerase)